MSGLTIHFQYSLIDSFRRCTAGHVFCFLRYSWEGISMRLSLYHYLEGSLSDVMLVDVAIHNSRQFAANHVEAS